MMKVNTLEHTLELTCDATAREEESVVAGLGALIKIPLLNNPETVGF